MKKTLIPLCLITLISAGLYGAVEIAKIKKSESDRIQNKIEQNINIKLPNLFQPDPNSFAGNFLVSQFAQHQQRWDDAGKFINALKSIHPDINTLVKQRMILDLHAQNLGNAAEAAKKILDNTNEDEISRTVAALVIISNNFVQKDYAQAAENIKTMPQSQLAVFMTPILQDWISTQDKTIKTKALVDNLFYTMQAIYIADYKGETDKMRPLIINALMFQDITGADIERLADIYLHIGIPEDALKLYEELLKISPHSNRIKNKITTLKNLALGTIEKPVYYKTMPSPAAAMAQAYYDMAYILYRDQAHESARIFAALALTMNPDLTEAHILFASMALKQGYYEQAIEHFKAVKPSSAFYLEAQREAASAYENAGNPDRAMSILNDLYKTHNDIEALIQIGDIQRRLEKFEASITSYNKAADQIGTPLPADYWYLLYARGMSYERAGQWEKAEQDLLAALGYQPDHPYILNYLGYAWIEKNMNLERAMDMIEQALEAEPDDGFITDSLGWAHYKIGNYEQAVPFLEKAIELAPSDPTINDHLGDAYWQVGRKIEARYQWKRALSFMTSAEEQKTLTEKIENGLPQIDHKETGG